MTATLYGLSYSPWTERARWALDHHGIRYQWAVHRLYLGEGALRRRAKAKPGERASVPLFVDGDLILRDSIDILLHADERGRGSKLVADRAALTALVALVEPGLHAMRGRVVSGTIESPDCIREHAAEVVPGFMAGMIAPVVVRASRFIGDKYGATMERDGKNLDVIRQTLRALRDRVDTSFVPGPTTLRAEHILLATFLQGIQPVTSPHIKLKPATRAVWTCTPLTDEAKELLAWRDATYAQARSLPPRT